MPDSITISFQEDKVYEVVMFSVKEGKLEQLVNQYLPNAMPIVTEYDGKPLITFQGNLVDTNDHLHKFSLTPIIQ